MTIEQILLIIAGAVFLILIVALVIYVKKNKKTKEENEAIIEEYFQNNGEIVECRAEVIDMSCGAGMVGGKVARSVKWFSVKFEKYDGEIIDLFVDEEMYEAIEVGMRGKLRLVDGRLNSFEVD